jgi:hypothetical protein
VLNSIDGLDTYPRLITPQFLRRPSKFRDFEDLGNFSIAIGYPAKSIKDSIQVSSKFVIDSSRSVIIEYLCEVNEGTHMLNRIGKTVSEESRALWMPCLHILGA